MKFSFSFLILVFIINISCSNKRNDLSDSNWKICGKNIGFTDILIFSDKLNFERNDTIFLKNDSAIAVIDTITFHYGERRLYVKSISDNKIYRYCEK